MSHQSTRRLGSACRIYKNATGKIIAIDSIEVTANELRVKTIFRMSVDKINISRTILHLETGGSRVVSSVQMIGTYTSIEENNGNFFIATWEYGLEAGTTVVVSFEAKVAKIGDII